MRRAVAVACVAATVVVAVLLVLGRGCDAPTGGGSAPVAAPHEEPRHPGSASSADGAEAPKPRRAPAAPVDAGTAAPDETLRGVVRLREGGSPVAGAKVRLRVGEPSPCIDERSGSAVPALGVREIETPFVAETSTDAEGRFSYGRAPTGPWRVVATGEGIAVGSCTGAGPADVLLDVEGVRPTRLQFKRRGEDVPVPGAEVLLWDGPVAGPPDARHVADEEATTTLSVHRGTTVLVRAEGYATKIVSSLWGQGDVLVLMDPAEAVTGVVLLPDGSPAAGAEVHLLDGPVQRDAADVGFAIRGVAGPDGVFRIERRSDFRWSLVVIDVPGFPRFRAVVREGETEIIVRLEEPAFVEVAVVDRTGAPFDDVRVGRYVGQCPGPDTGEGRTLGGGRFEVGPLHPGIVLLVAEPESADRYSRAWVTVALHPGERGRRVRMVVEEKVPATLLVRLRCGDEFVPGKVRVQAPDGSLSTVEVEDRAVGAPLHVPPGETVTVTALPGVGGQVRGPAVTAVAGTAESPSTVDLPLRDGRRARPLFVDAESGLGVSPEVPFEVTGTGVSEGMWEEEFSLAADARFRFRIEVKGYARYDAEHTAADAVDGVLTVRLSRGAIVRGRVVDAAGAPSQLGVEARLGGGGSSKGLVGTDGSFELVGLGSGTGALEVSCSGIVVHSVPIRVGADGASLGEVRVPSLRTVRGRVVDERGRGVSPASVEVRAGDLGGELTTDREGSFEVTLPEGLPFVLHASWRYDVARPVRVAAADQTARLVLEPGPRILFRVPWREREAARVLLRDPGGAIEWETTRSRTGDLLHVGGLPPGSWDVVFRRPSGDVVVRVDAAPGEIREIVVGE